MRALIPAARVAFALCVLATLWSAFASGEGPPLLPWDKAQHFCAFFALTASAVAAFPRLSLPVITFGLGAAGAGIELVQSLPFVHRDASVLDWAADIMAIGAVLGVILAARIRRSTAGGN